MKKALLILLFTILHPLATHAQLTFELADLKFYSTFEQESVREIHLQEPSDPQKILPVFMAVNPKNGAPELKQAQAKIAAIIRDLEKEKIGEKKFKKSAKIIFERVHSHLRLYKEIAHFDQIFDDGTYNCLTASALFAFVLEHFKIPYALIEMPTHVFVLLDPGGENIWLETTDPTDGLFRLDKSKVVAELRQQKLISEAEAQQKNDEELYDIYFKKMQVKITLNQLAGLAYHNYAVDQFAKKEYQKSVSSIEKASYFYRSEGRDELRMIALSTIIDNTESFERPEDYAPYFALYDYPAMHQKLNVMLEEIFEKTARKYLMESYNEPKFDQFYQYFVGTATLRKQSVNFYHFINYFYKGLNAGMKNNFAKSLTMLDSANMLKPHNTILEQLMGASIVECIRKDKYLFRPTNTDSLLIRYAFLKDNKDFIAEHCQHKLKSTLDLFDNGNEKEAFAALAAYEPTLATLKSQSDLEYHLSVQLLYNAASRVFIKKDDYKQCRLWLEKGLERSPNNDFLLHQMEMVKEHIRQYGEDPYPNRVKSDRGSKSKGKN